MSTKTSELLTQDDYQVGWICALPLEAAAATALLDEEHPSLDQEPGDTNAYTLGRIGPHHVVIGCLPLGSMGESSATAVAKDMLRSFPNIRIGLMVGVGGGAPGPPSERPEDDIRLGDIVVSKPGPGHGGIIQYDYGKTLSEGEFVDIGYLNRPPNVLLAALTKLLSRIELEGSSVSRQIADIGKKYPRKIQDWQYQGVENDQLFAENFRHADIHRSCKDIHCAHNEDRLVSRKPRASTDPVIHCGLIASGNQVMRDSVTREKLRKKHGVLCFEMEAAGLNNNFQCLVVRGICDYSDSHKNKRWQQYAAIASAAFTKELLQAVPLAQLERAQRVSFIAGKVEKEVGKLHDIMKPLLQTQKREERWETLDWLAPAYYHSQQADVQRHLDHESGKAFVEHERFKSWSQGSKVVKMLFCPGLPGAGKTSIASIVIDILHKARKKQRSGVAFFYLSYNLRSQQTPMHILRAILRQLVETLPSIPHEIAELHYADGEPSLHKIFDILAMVIKTYGLVFVVIDALDECSPESLEELLDAVQRLQGLGARFMLTTRFTNIVEKKLRDMDNCLSLEIRATDRDMATYITRNFDFSVFYQLPDDSLEVDRFKEVVIGAAKGLFILVRLFLNILKNKCTRGEIQDELDNIQKRTTSDPLHEAYQKTMHMIANTGRSEWAFRIISWVFHAQRPLGAKELTEAIAAQTQRNMNCLNMDYAPSDIQTVISYCSGLVVLSPISEKIEFVHLTAYQYFEGYRHEHPWIEESRKEISIACLKYLSFDPFAAKSEHTSFLDYAVHFWADHIKLVETDREVREVARFFLRNNSLTSSADRIFPANDHSYISLSSLVDDIEVSGATGLHLVARFGLVTQLEDLLEEMPAPEVNSRDPYGQTPLILAARHGNADVVGILLSRNYIDQNLTDDDCLSPLSIASQLGHSGIVQSLLSNGGTDPNLPASDGWSPIMYAARGGHKEIIQLLLADDKVNPNYASPDGQTALTLAVAMGFADVVGLLLASRKVKSLSPGLGDMDTFMIALQSGNRDVIRLLLQDGYDNATASLTTVTVADCMGLSAYNGMESERIFWLAIEKGLVEVIILLLQSKKVNPNITNSGSRTALMVAVDNRHKEVVEALLCVGSASVNLMADNGDTALFLAVARRDVEITRILLETGMADPNLGCQSPFKYPLPHAVDKNYQDIVRILLETGKTDPNPGLQAAISGRQIPTIRKFLSLPGVDPNTQDRTKGQTALMVAIREQDLGLVQVLLENKMVDINARNWSGETALMRAVTMYDLEVVKLLVEDYGADIGIRSEYGATALDWAEKYGWSIDEVMRLLSPKRSRTA